VPLQLEAAAVVWEYNIPVEVVVGLECLPELAELGKLLTAVAAAGTTVESSRSEEPYYLAVLPEQELFVIRRDRCYTEPEAPHYCNHIVVVAAVVAVQVVVVAPWSYSIVDLHS